MQKNWILVAAWMFSILLAVTFLQPLRERRPPDFMPFYFGGKLAVAGQISKIYDRPTYQPLITDLRATGERMNPVDAHYFIRPAFQAFLYAPFTVFSYPTASWLAVLFNLGLLGILVWKLPVWLDVSPSIRFCLLCFLPFLWSIGIGQDTLLLALLVAYSMRLASRGQDVWAGVLLALGAYKPHLIWAVPLAMLAAGRWQMLGSFLAVGLALAGISFAAVGMSGTRQWVELVQAPSSDYLPHIMGNIRSVGIHFGVAAGIAAALLTVLCLAWVLRRGSFPEKCSAALIAAVLLSPHTYWQDYSLVAVAVLLLRRPAIHWVTLLPWPYFYPRKDLLPLVFLSIGVLGLIAIHRRLYGGIPREQTRLSTAEGLSTG